MNSPTFNIIYLPGTVKFQTIPLLSLLLNTSFKFRLVGNSLNFEESELLSKIASHSSRLDVLTINSEKILPHGTLLDLLFFHEKHKLFCFMDPDIFAFNPVHENESELLKDGEVFSSCSRLENEPDSTYSGFKGGATTISPDGQIPLATSFFCIYKRQALNKSIQKYNIGFEQYRSNEQIPTKALNLVNHLNLEFTMFDTGKLLSVVMEEMGYKKIYEPIDGLVHIGGMSGRYLSNNVFNFEEINKSIEKITLESSQSRFNVRNRNEIRFKKILGTFFYGYLNHIINSNLPVPEIKHCSTEQMKIINYYIDKIDRLMNQLRSDNTCQRILNIVASNNLNG